MKKCFLILIWILITPASSLANPSYFNLDLNDTNLADAIRIMAKFLNQNVVISSNVNGTATLHLHHANPASAFTLLLTSHGLAKWQMGNIWFVAPRDELIKRKQEELKWQAVWEESQPLVTTLWRIKYAKADELARMLQDDQSALVSKRGHVRVDLRTNMICVQDTEEHIASIRRLVRQLDVPTKQITIEARLASVDNDFERELGIDFTVKQPNEITSQQGRYSIAVATLADGSHLDVKLAALESAGHAELISSPSLFTSNQQPASIEAGEEVPYQEVSESGGTAVVFKKAVLGLKVTPQVLPGNNVLLQLQINQDRPSNTMVLGMPVIRTRQMMSVLVKDGKTIVLGGFMKQTMMKGSADCHSLTRCRYWVGYSKISAEWIVSVVTYICTPRIMTQAHEDNAE